MISVRLDSSLEHQLNHFIKEYNMTKTQVIREALSSFFDAHTTPKQTPYELGKDLFGLDGSGRSDLSTTYKKRIKEQLRLKYNRSK